MTSIPIRGTAVPVIDDRPPRRLRTEDVFVQPTWEYLPVAPHERPEPPAAVVPPYMVHMAYGDRDAYQRRTDRLQGTTRGYAGTPEQVMVASLDPMGVHTWSLALEAAATQLLHGAGHHADRPDVFSRRHRTHVARPDLVAFKGLPRADDARPTPCRYGGQRGHARAVKITRQAWITPDVSAPVVVTELLTLLGGKVGEGAQVRQGWRGHRFVEFTFKPRARGAGATAKRAAVKVARAATKPTATKGRAVTPWAMSARSIPRWFRADTPGAAERCATAATIDQVLRIATLGAHVTFGPLTVEVLDGASVLFHDHAYPVREFARRAALAGVDPIDS